MIKNSKIALLTTNRDFLPVIDKHPEHFIITSFESLTNIVSLDTYVVLLVDIDSFEPGVINLDSLSIDIIIFTKQAEQYKSLPKNISIITKPICINELFLMLGNIVTKHSNQNIIFGQWQLNIKKRLIFNGKYSIELTQMEVDIIRYLYNEARLVRRDELLNEIWGYNSVNIDTHTVETHIYRLRKKLGYNIITTSNNSYKLL